MESLAIALSHIPGVTAVTLGGSRAQGTHRDDSDWDFGLYYRGRLDPDDVRALGFEGQVFAPGDWAEPMHGGAWLRVDGVKVDLIYRDLERVEKELERAERGEFDICRVPGSLVGMPSYVLLGELALGRGIVGALPRPSFPAALRARAASRWRWEAEFWLRIARGHLERDDPVAVVGVLVAATLATAHALAASQGRWVLNEKWLVDASGLEDVQALASRAWAAERLRQIARDVGESLRRRLGSLGEVPIGQGERSQEPVVWGRQTEVSRIHMDGELVTTIVQGLREAGIDVWIDGGWGIDALIGRQSRPHDDLDLAPDRDHLANAQQTLEGLGFRHDPQARPGMPARFVTRDEIGRQVDVHLLLFDRDGNGWQQLSDTGRCWGHYPAEDLKARGIIAGREVRCLSAALQFRFHLGYEWSSRDEHDLRLLAERFPVGPLP